MCKSSKRRRESDLQALARLTILAANALDKQLMLPGADANAVDLADDAVQKLREVVEAVTTRRQDEQARLRDS